MLNRRFIVAGVCITCGAAAFLIHLSIIAGKPLARTTTEAFVPSEGCNNPVGSGKGIHPGRVVWVHDRAATLWDGTTGYWWESENTNQAAVNRMMSRSIRWLTGAATDETAWDAVFKHFNQEHGKGAQGYQAGEKLAIKLNFNNSQQVDEKETNKNAQNPSPHLTLALLSQLVEKAGVAEANISVCDPSRFVTKAVYDFCRKEFPGVRFVDRLGTGGHIKVQPDTTAALFFADSTVELSGKTYIARCLVEADYIINCGLLRAHDIAGISVCAKNHFGSIWKHSPGKWHEGWSPGGEGEMKGLHGYIVPFDFDNYGWKFAARPAGSYNPLVEFMGHKHLGAKTLLFMVDGLYASKYQYYAHPFKWQWTPFGTPQNPHWSSSVLVSQDGVAIESVVLDIIRNEPTFASFMRGAIDNYLHEAAQADQPPSGVTYDPEGDGTRPASLGVHEHWNNARERKYGRNMGRSEGIELITNQPTNTKSPRFHNSGELSVSVGSIQSRTVTFTVQLPSAGAFDLSVHDMAGRTVWACRESTSASACRITWNLGTSFASALPEGKFLVRIQQGHERASRMFTLSR